MPCAQPNALRTPNSLAIVKLKSKMRKFFATHKKLNMRGTQLLSVPEKQPASP